MQQRKLNYKFKPDPRLPKFRTVMHKEHDRAAEILPEVDLEVSGPHVKVAMQPVRDQENEGSCTAFSSVGHYESLVHFYKPDFEKISEQGFYKIERKYDGDFSEDAGSSLSSAAHVAFQTGFPAASLDPYLESTEFKKLSVAELKDAALHKIGHAYAINTPEEMQICLSNGYGFVGGIICAKQLMDDGFKGILPLLTAADVLVEDGSPAGHAVHCIGYKQINGELYFKWRNSWGADYGDKGSFWMHSKNMFDPNWVSDCQTFRLAHQPGM